MYTCFVPAKLANAIRRAGFAGCSLGVATLAGFGSISPVAIAQEEGVQEILVTARFREENVQDTPLSITAITGDMLEEQNIQSVEDLGLIIPNANIRATTGNSGPDARIGLRGVDQSDYNPVFEPGVAVYVDDVYHGTLAASTFDLLDLERVEVLRGPQGTLFGKNTMGGAIRLFSKAPRGENTGHVQLVAGDRERLDLSASYDFAVTDNVFMRVSGVSKSIEGYQKRLDYTCQMNANGTPELAGDLPSLLFSTRANNGDCEIGMKGGQQMDSGRLAMRFLPTDTLSFDLTADFTKSNNEPGVDSLINGRDPNGGFFDASYQTNVIDPLYNSNGGQLTILGNSFVTGDPYTSYASFVDPVNGIVWDDEQTNESRNASARMNYEISNNMNLKAIVGYRSYETFWNNGDQTPFSFNNFTIDQEHDQLSFELQLSGLALDDRLEWTTGAYYFDSETYMGGAVTFGTFGIPGFTLNDTFKTESRSVFVHGVYELTDTLSVSAGLRSTSEDKTYAYDHPGTPPIGEPLEYGQTQTDWKVSLDYSLNEDMLVYGMASTGFRSEGANPRPYTPAQLLPTPMEELVAYEIGMKSDWFDNRLRVNVAAFLNDYDPRLATTLLAQCTDPTGTDPGEPWNTANGPCPAGTFAEGTNGQFWEYYTSAPGEGKGFEIELTAFPVENLMVNASYGYYKYTSNQEPGTPGYIHPSAKQQADDSFNIGAQYTWNLENGATLSPRLDWFHQGERSNGDLSQPRISPWHVVPSYDHVNFRLTYTNQDATWVTSLEVQNLFDKFYWIDYPATRGNDGVTPTYRTFGVPSAPRQVGISFRRNFD